MGFVEYLKRGAYFILFGVPEYKTKVDIQVMEPQNLLIGRNIIITGGGRGIGYYIAKRSIAEGANVLITGRNEQTLIEAVESLGKKARYLVADVSKVKEIDLFLETNCIAENKVKEYITDVVCGIEAHQKEIIEQINQELS